mmetsp:Transcript_22770/g.54456  ORF Transcript_22770/g.54456 Transcript_22770/m.54456 type:complete len:266 (+) Transcript_22770:235-1032(+)
MGSRALGPRSLCLDAAAAFSPTKGPMPMPLSGSSNDRVVVTGSPLYSEDHTRGSSRSVRTTAYRVASSFTFRLYLCTPDVSPGMKRGKRSTTMRAGVLPANLPSRHGIRLRSSSVISATISFSTVVGLGTARAYPAVLARNPQCKAIRTSPRRAASGSSSWICAAWIATISPTHPTARGAIHGAGPWSRRGGRGAISAGGATPDRGGGGEGACPVAGARSGESSTSGTAAAGKGASSSISVAGATAGRGGGAVVTEGTCEAGSCA